MSWQVADPGSSCPVFWSRCCVHSGCSAMRWTTGRHAARRWASVHDTEPKQERMSMTSIQFLPEKSAELL